jgi:hypothetical protein
MVLYIHLLIVLSFYIYRLLCQAYISKIPQVNANSMQEHCAGPKTASTTTGFSRPVATLCNQDNLAVVEGAAPSQVRIAGNRRTRPLHHTGPVLPAPNPSPRASSMLTEHTQQGLAVGTAHSWMIHRSETRGALQHPWVVGAVQPSPIQDLRPTVMGSNLTETTSCLQAVLRKNLLCIRWGLRPR